MEVDLILTYLTIQHSFQFSVNPINQGIKIEWTAPSGALNTTFKMQCIALVNSLYL